MLTALSKLPAPLIYGVSVAIEKCFSLLTIPLMAAYLSPSEYGTLDVTITLTEFLTLIAGFGLTEQLIRFASVAKTEREADACASELLGCALLGSLVVCALGLALSGMTLAALSLPIDIRAFYVIVVAACFSNCIGLPLAWLRLQNDAVTFLYLVVGRTCCQVLGIWYCLSHGYGAEGVLIANGVVLIAFACVLTALQYRKTGISFSFDRFGQVARYGVPIVGAMLAMYLLGTANRLFMINHVSVEMIGYVGLAARLALATSLLLYPLELWWLPKRIVMLEQEGGLARSAGVWGVGLALLIASGMGVALAGPVFIVLLLPETYVPALVFLPLLVIVQIMHDVAGLTETGSYARESGYRVLMIDCLGAGVAVLCFLAFIPFWGVYGAIFGVFAGQALRIAGYLWDGAELAPIPYPWKAAVACCLMAGAIVYFAPMPQHLVASVLWLAFGAIAMATAFIATRLVVVPAEITARLSAIWR